MTKLTSLYSLIFPHLEYIFFSDRGPLSLLQSKFLLVWIHRNLLFFVQKSAYYDLKNLHILNRSGPLSEKIIYSRWRKIKEHSDVTFVIGKWKWRRWKFSSSFFERNFSSILETTSILGRARLFLQCSPKLSKSRKKWPSYRSFCNKCNCFWNRL